MMTTLPSIATVDLSHLKTKSARIRHLKDLGYRQADIARHLGILDQHVSNVVRGPRPKSETGPSTPGVVESTKAFAGTRTLLPVRLIVERSGVVRLPASWDVATGSVFIARKFGGSIVLMDAADASEAARSGQLAGNAVDDLIAERRLEAMREFDD
jgi:hypothetical protein